MLLSAKTKTFVDKIKKENNGKRRRKKKADTWIKLILYPAEISHSPYDILTELNEKLDQLDATVQEQAAESGTSKWKRLRWATTNIKEKLSPKLATNNKKALGANPVRDNMIDLF